MSVLKELEGLLRDRGYLQEGESIPVVLKDEIDRSESNIGFCAENNAVVALSVRYCALTSLPESLGQLTNLRRLDLNGNQLTSLPDWLGNLVQLRRLYLGYDQLSSLAYWLENLITLDDIN